MVVPLSESPQHDQHPSKPQSVNFLLVGNDPETWLTDLSLPWLFVFVRTYDTESLDGSKSPLLFLSRRQGVPLFPKV